MEKYFLMPLWEKDPTGGKGTPSVQGEGKNSEKKSKGGGTKQCKRGRSFSKEISLGETQALWTTRRLVWGGKRES